MSDKFPVTVDGFARMEAELKQLVTVERPKISKEIATAREHGDLKENAEYHAARDKQSFMEGRIQYLEDKIARAQVIDTSKFINDHIIKFGAIVDVVDDDTEEESTYRIVGEYEADIKKNLISITSPLARALIGKTQGDSVEVTTPKGIKGFEILSLKYE